MYIAETKRTEHLLFLTHKLICTLSRETKGTVYTSLRNLHLDSLKQKVYMAHNNDIDAYVYTTSELMHCLLMRQISLYWVKQTFCNILKSFLPICVLTKSVYPLRFKSTLVPSITIIVYYFFYYCFVSLGVVRSHDIRAIAISHCKNGKKLQNLQHCRQIKFIKVQLIVVYIVKKESGSICVKRKLRRAGTGLTKSRIYLVKRKI